METLQKCMPWKKVGDHPAWRKVCATWYKMIFSDWIISHDFSTLEYKEWNPWKDWCNTWKEFESSGEKPPKSKKQKADMFSELFNIAKLMSDKLEELKTTRADLESRTNENESLRNQNVAWQRTCEDLHRQLDAEKQMVIDMKYKWETEVNRREALESEKKMLTFQVLRMEDKLQQAQDECRELESKISSSEGQLMECRNENRYQIIIKNDINVFSKNEQRKENVLDVDSIRDRLGQLNGENVFDWLCSFEVEYNLSNWSGTDIEHILRGYTDFNNVSSLLPIVKMGRTTWLGMFKQIAEFFFPDLDDVLDTEQMRRNDKVLQYFHRMWMIYRITEYPDDVSVNDPKYKNAVCNGLLPHLYDEVNDVRDEDYEVLEQVAISVEKVMKAGAGFPSRKEIWDRLQRHDVPYDEIHRATYYKLFVCLSRYEDL